MSSASPTAGEVQAAIAVLERWATEHPIEEARIGLDRATVRAAVGAAARLYSGAVEEAGREIRPVEADVTTTDAVRLSVALLRSQGLTPFEMAMWFGQSNQEEGATARKSVEDPAETAGRAAKPATGKGTE